MSMTIGEKIRVLREAESLTRDQMAELVGVKAPTLKSYEAQGRDPSGSNLEKIFAHERFKKYSLWFWTSQDSPVVGQVTPGQSNLSLSLSFKEKFIEDAKVALSQMGAMKWFEKTERTDLNAIASALFVSCHPSVNCQTSLDESENSKAANQN